MDREKVIKQIEKCIIDTSCIGCPYEKSLVCRHYMLADALAILKEQGAEIRQLRLALDIAKGTCKGIVFETDEN